MDTPTSLIVLMYLIISFVIYVPLSCSGIYSYLKYYHHIMMTKRYSNLTLTQCILLLMTIIIGSVAQLYGYLNLTHIQTWFIQPCFILTLVQMYVFICRIYLNYYDIKYAMHVTNNKWKELINTESAEMNWYIQNRSTYGSLNYWIKYIVLFTILSILAIYSSLLIYPPNNSTFFDSVTYQNIVTFILGSIGTGIIVYIRYKVWKLQFHDSIYFGKEIHLSLILGVIALSCNAIIIGITWIAFPSLQYFGFATVLFIFVNTFYVWIYIFTNWVIKKNMTWLQFHMNESNFSKMHVLIDAGSDSSVQKSPYTSVHVNQLDLRDVLLDIDGFQCLIRHILSEFALEILICLIEVQQFQQYVSQNVDDLTEYNQDLLPIFYPEIIVPESTIVYGALPDKYANIINKYKKQQDDTIIYELKIRAFLLYNKYIRVNSDFEINIPFMIRKQLAVQMDEIDEWLDMDTDINRNDQLLKLLGLFESVTKEQYSLLRCAFTRFKGTAVYKKLRTQKTK
eukprot:48595_1